MISNNIHVKVVESLRVRKLKVEKTYENAGVLGFWLPAIFFGVQVIYHVCRLLVADMGAITMLFSDVIVESSLLKFIENFNLPMIIACLVFAIDGYFAFGFRARGAKYLYIGLCAVLAVLSVVMIIRSYWVWVYVVSFIYCVMMFFVTIGCIKAQDEDRLLSKSEGYPHFNSILMQDEKTEKSLLRFREKKSPEEIYDERLREYASEYPDSQMARIYRKEQEEHADTEIGDWLDGMMTKSEDDSEN